MEQKFEDILKEGIEKILLNKGISRQTANPFQLGKALTELYLIEIGQYHYPINEDDIEENICDGKGDLGIDFVLQKDKDWIIFQAKYKGQSSCVTPDEISGFFSVYSKITDEGYFEKHANNKLKELLLDFNKDDTIQFVFVSNDKISSRIEEDFIKHKDEAERRYENVTYELKGLTDLKRDYKAATSEMETIAEEIKITLEAFEDTFINKTKSAYLDLSSVIDKENKYKSILCTIKGTTLKGLWEQHKSRLFNYNIRGYLGENAINKKMKETLELEPDKFYFYNNGISAICTEMKAELVGGEVKSFSCKNFSIINGAQTTTTIGRYKNVANLRDVRILLRITKSEDYKKEKGLNKKIINYNNSQTIIKASDFRSNDEIQIFLENKVKDFQFKGAIPFKKVMYQRKRIKIDKKKEILYMSMETLARALYVFDYDPILIFKGTKYLFDIDTENNGKYWLIFGDNGSDAEWFDNKKMEKIISIYFIWVRVEDRIKTICKKLKFEKKETIEYQALLAKWHILWAYGYILNNFYSVELESIFKKISSSKIFDGSSDTFIEKWFSKIHKTIAKCIEKNYHLTKKKGTEEIQSFNFKNWLRNNSEFEELVTEFKYMEKSDFPL